MKILIDFEFDDIEKEVYVTILREIFFKEGIKVNSIKRYEEEVGKE